MTLRDDGGIMVAAGIAREADAEFARGLLEEAQQLTGVRVEAVGGSLSIWCDMPPAPEDGDTGRRIEQIQAYAQGCVDTLAKAGGRSLDQPEHQEKGA